MLRESDWLRRLTFTEKITDSNSVRSTFKKCQKYCYKLFIHELMNSIELEKRIGDYPISGTVKSNKE